MLISAIKPEISTSDISRIWVGGIVKFVGRKSEILMGLSINNKIAFPIYHYGNKEVAQETVISLAGTAEKNLFSFC